jgi:hypothetical protein
MKLFIKTILITMLLGVLATPASASYKVGDKVAVKAFCHTLQAMRLFVKTDSNKHLSAQEHARILKPFLKEMIAAKRCKMLAEPVTMKVHEIIRTYENRYGSIVDLYSFQFIHQGKVITKYSLAFSVKSATR